MLKYHNDGKEKWQSHEIYESGFSEVNTGYGETKEEAFSNFKQNVKAHIDGLINYYDNNLKIESAVEVDCSGEPILEVNE